MGEPKNPDFYDFEIFGRVPEPQNQYYLSSETPGSSTRFKKKPDAFLQTHYVREYNFANSNFQRINNLNLLNNLLFCYILFSQ